MTKEEQIATSFKNAIDHVREEPDDCDLCRMRYDTAEKVRSAFPDEWFGDDLPLVEKVVESLKDY